MPRLAFVQVAEATRRALERRGDVVANALMFASDSKRAERLKEMICPGCAYGGPRLAGQSFTAWNCFQCGKTAQHHNTAVPRLCLECATELALCSWCCADINLGNRRNVHISKAEARRRLR